MFSQIINVAKPHFFLLFFEILRERQIHIQFPWRVAEKSLHKQVVRRE